MYQHSLVNTWIELQQELFSNSWDTNINRFRSKFVFRGLTDSHYKLATRLIRLGGEFKELEHHLIRNFKKYAHNEAAFDENTWNWLAMAQHHGLPTRLLDWTYSPYVAMHFATSNIDKMNIDGAIWMLNYVDSNKLIPNKLKKELENEGSNVFTADMISNECENLPEFDKLGKDFLIFFEPPSIDDRIINQYALFSMFSDSEQILDDWLKVNNLNCKKIIIPAKLKWEIRDKLDQANITERVLFPGLDGLSAWLKRHYSPVF